MQSGSAGALHEEYYQISQEILASLPRFRPPLDLYCFKEEISELQPYFYAGRRLSKEMQEELGELCRQGKIFVSRSDHPVYIKHISAQLDLVLVDTNLREVEIVKIFRQALTRRIHEFFEQPVKPVLDKLGNDVMVLTEYLSKDPFRIRSLFRNLHTEPSLAGNAYNTGVIGLSLYLGEQESDFKRRFLDQLALGLFLHELGLSKVPRFVLEKKHNLTPDEQQKIVQHPVTGAGILQRMGVRDDVVLQCVLEHRERIDGSGTPRKLSGKELSWPGRICAVANAFNARVMERCRDQSHDYPAAARDMNTVPGLDAKLITTLQNLVFGELAAKNQ